MSGRLVMRVSVSSRTFSRSATKYAHVLCSHLFCCGSANINVQGKVLVITNSGFTARMISKVCVCARCLLSYFFFPFPASHSVVSPERAYCGPLPKTANCPRIKPGVGRSLVLFAAESRFDLSLLLRAHHAFSHEFVI
jgi:hypothetical protein